MRHFSSAACILLLCLSFLPNFTPIRAQGLSAPTLQATAAEEHTVALRWTDAEQFRTNRIYRKSGGSDWTLVAETGEANGYWDRTTAGGVTYTYRVQGVTLDGRSVYSNEASATTDGPTLEPPFRTPSLSAEAASHNSVRLRWNDITLETHYILERGHPGNWIAKYVLPANTTEFIETGLIPASQYFYRIRGRNDAGFSPESVAIVNTDYDPNIIPPVPTLYVYPYTDTALTLSWNYTPQANGYRVESKTASGPWIEITNVTLATDTFVIHENLTPATAYTYRMRAYNGAGLSDYSAERTTSTYPPPPPSPDLRGIPVTYKEIELRWTDVLTNCCTTPETIGYKLEVWNGSEWSHLFFAGVDQTNHFVRGLEPGEYTYRIQARHPLSSEWSTITVRTMDPPPIVPDIPTFYADPGSSTVIKLKWLDVELETGYQIERENYPSGGVWQPIITLPANSTSYNDLNLEPGTLYIYRIRAVNSFGASPYSHEAAATTPPLPGFLTLKAGPYTPTAVRLFVEPAEEKPLQYQVERLNENNQWIVLIQTNRARLLSDDTGLLPATSYTYRVGSRFEGYPGWWYSSEVTTQTWPLDLTVQARPISSTGVELSWPKIPYAEHVYIFRPGLIFTEIDGSYTNYIDSGLTPSTTYTYRVYATSAVGGRSPETEVTITTPGSISGDIVITSIAPANNGANFRLRLIGSTGQKFKVQSSTNFISWTDQSETQTLTADTEIVVPSAGAAAFFCTIKVE